jgi:hypothetical protein
LNEETYLSSIIPSLAYFVPESKAETYPPSHQIEQLCQSVNGPLGHAQKRSYLWTPERLRQRMHMTARRMDPDPLGSGLEERFVGCPDSFSEDIIEDLNTDTHTDFSGLTTEG